MSRQPQSKPRKKGERIPKDIVITMELEGPMTEEFKQLVKETRRKHRYAQVIVEQKNQ